MSFFGFSRSRVATFSKFTASVALTGAGGWQLWTRHCYFEPFGPENDPIFQSDHYKRLNPENHPSLKDSCVRKVPLSQIPPELVEDTLKGGSKLVERFCAGVWGGYGTNVTDHFVVIGKNPKSIVLWGANAPSDNPGVRRDMENIAEVTTNIDVGQGVAEFRLKNIFYNGVERTCKDLFPRPIVWLHFQYCKLLVEGGVSYCKA
ncbi:hypothetical protein N7499_004250 [Penicillium canescens]|uniref:Uncharacterized protein n=1 Tax=Penicillium canescens TaxID=5083 RepID=A0AAD6N399_PENCN|nr:uncharacterized protein N7446_005002 [Penicillium canescens]KAJ6012365.1 hypothetical protein N7522_002720 [Penicillium canescens]KAJ6026396.1 hypothetical protein N7460_011213 [Penicillium canescens]KAJ6039671.1 hypothetical protein N7444_008576 [Penicillium canescens]KAJ6067965.1 hypothetical protein N7446_005002 [Penicillium canescens]KAJ6088068.1 hypothetical protein N7499_004250 [Penicillium canescens]